MSPTRKPVRNIKVKVPRHNSQRLGPAVTAQVEAFARADRVRVDIRQTAYDSSSALAQAIESASEWNSLLLTARADRGPQWDIGTQQFLVEEYSDLYYDPTPLLEYQKDGRPAADGEDGLSARNAANDRQDVPSTPKTQSHRAHNMPHPAMHTPHHLHSQSQLFPGGAQPNMASPRHPFSAQALGGQGMSGQGMGGQGMGFGGMNMNANMGMGMNPIPPTQFYGGSQAADSPMRMGNAGMGMGGMGMNVPGNMGMGGMGMGIPGADGMNMGMGMGMGMGSPDPRRRLTRGMSGDDGFGGMHG
ncbi:uncharacterized protein FIBRA_03458 [Fibroporia radiculosa]|uniref:Uncharacterized protein n=1 Tax=Fibroporia radiculosa TaxID=599839 RepID=J4HW02_9APHY|nr:uncharacterized protein FIBRA_03458 [Fibroporia radiculosa]CCM01407.1 predicted protein [Fibroporia radiculosa]